VGRRRNVNRLFTVSACIGLNTLPALLGRSNTPANMSSDRRPHRTDLDSFSLGDADPGSDWRAVCLGALTHGVMVLRAKWSRHRGPAVLQLRGSKVRKDPTLLVHPDWMPKEVRVPQPHTDLAARPEPMFPEGDHDVRLPLASRLLGSEGASPPLQVHSPGADGHPASQQPLSLTPGVRFTRTPDHELRSRKKSGSAPVPDPSDREFVSGSVPDVRPLDESDRSMTTDVTPSEVSVGNAVSSPRALRSSVAPSRDRLGDKPDQVLRSKRSKSPAQGVRPDRAKIMPRPEQPAVEPGGAESGQSQSAAAPNAGADSFEWRPTMYMIDRILRNSWPEPMPVALHASPGSGPTLEASNDEKRR
jgi:hypothetical protein